jgi:RNA 2',3'-cyclic 3'-phosphodiesterase
MIRLFAAIPVPEDLHPALIRRQTGVENARWRPPEALHITLRFYGELREDVAADLDDALSLISAPPFELVLRGVGAFGEGREVHAIWAGVEESEPLRHLARACETAARRIGLKSETRSYRPHVTLAYLRNAEPAEVGAWVQGANLLKSPAFTVDRFGLYSRRLAREGASYTLEREYPLLG